MESFIQSFILSLLQFTFYARLFLIFFRFFFTWQTFDCFISIFFYQYQFIFRFLIYLVYVSFYFIFWYYFSISVYVPYNKYFDFVIFTEFYYSLRPFLLRHVVCDKWFVLQKCPYRVSILTYSNKYFRGLFSAYRDQRLVKASWGVIFTKLGALTKHLELGVATTKIRQNPWKRIRSTSVVEEFTFHSLVLRVKLFPNWRSPQAFSRI